MPARESQAPKPVTDYGRSKLAAEEEVTGGCRTEFVILRPPAVYGPRDTEFLRLFKMIRRHLCPMFGGQTFSLVFVKDLAEATVACLTHPEAGKQIFNVASHEIVTSHTLRVRSRPRWEFGLSHSICRWRFFGGPAPVKNCASPPRDDSPATHRQGCQQPSQVVAVVGRQAWRLGWLGGLVGLTKLRNVRRVEHPGEEGAGALVLRLADAPAAAGPPRRSPRRP